MAANARPVPSAVRAALRLGAPLTFEVAADGLSWRVYLGGLEVGEGRAVAARWPAGARRWRVRSAFAGLAKRRGNYPDRADRRHAPIAVADLVDALVEAAGLPDRNEGEAAAAQAEATPGFPNLAPDRAKVLA